MIQVNPMTAADWRCPPPELPLLGSGMCQIWCCVADLADPAFDGLDAFLADEERQRLGRMARASDRRRRKVARGLLRWLLGGYLNAPAQEVAIASGPYGKPHLSTADACGIEFNVSHSDGIELIAIGRGVQVGVDVERIRPIPDVDLLSDVVWNSRERAELASLPPSQRGEAFLRGWVRKEACLKAMGLGFSQGPGLVSVSFEPDDAPLILSTEASAAAGGTRLTLASLDLPREYLGAVAIASQGS